MSALLQLAFQVELCFCAHYGLFGLPGLVIVTHFMAVVIYIVRMVALMPVWMVCRNRLNFDSTYITILLRHCVGTTLPMNIISRHCKHVLVRWWNKLY